MATYRMTLEVYTEADNPADAAAGFLAGNEEVEAAQ